MASVTIPGAGSLDDFRDVRQCWQSQLAIQIRDALVSASLQSPNLLNVTTVAGRRGLVPVPPTLTTGGPDQRTRHQRCRQLHHTGRISGCTRLRRGCRPDYYRGVTIHGAANSTILGGNVSIVDPALIVLPEEAGNAVVTISGIGDVVAGNNQNDTLTAAGFAGSISGGTGTNLFFDLGSNDTISAQGNNDTIFGGPNSATIQIASAASGEMVVGGEGTCSSLMLLWRVNAAGGDTIFGGDGVLNVTTSGAFARIVETGGGGIKAIDTGTADTIVGGLARPV